jgi:hypothetical protein
MAKPGVGDCAGDSRRVPSSAGVEHGRRLRWAAPRPAFTAISRAVLRVRRPFRRKAGTLIWTDQPLAETRSGLVIARRTALKLPPLLAAGMALTQLPRAAADPERWTPERAHRWHAAQGNLVGANFITSNSINQLEMFQPATWDARRIDAELHIASQIGLNAVRVFLHDQLWVQDRPGFQLRLAQFVGCAARYGIKPLFVFFDSCWDPFPRLGPQRPPRPGVHNSGWVQSPGADRLGDPGYRGVMRDYVTGVMHQFRKDDRVLGWDLWNEPDNPSDVYRAVERPDKLVLVAELLPQVFRWARSVDATQPLTSGVWQGEWADPGQRSPIAAIQLDNSDVVTFHSYADPVEFEAKIAQLAPIGRPMMCTEYMARPLGSSVPGIVPTALRHNVGAFNWGLIAGKTQTYLPWDSWDHPYLAPPVEWFHDLIHPDGLPYRQDEIDTIRVSTANQPLIRRPHPNPDWRNSRGRRPPG